MDASILSSCTNSYDICSANLEADLSETDDLDVEVLESEESEFEEIEEVCADL